MSKQRLDALVFARALAASREQARRLIMAGEVVVNGRVMDKPGALVADDARVEVMASPRFVSRGGEKLAAALERFGIDVTGLVCADVGASTGGFTDCLLQHGAARVYAIDVGYGQLAWKLRNDPRVAVMEKTNARHVQRLPEPIHLATVDASFISLRLLLPVVRGWLAGDGAAGQGGQGGRVIALVKPQFEAGPEQVGKGGVVRDAEVHRRILADVTRFSEQAGWGVRGLMASPLKGPAGNVEFLLYLSVGSSLVEAGAGIDAALMEASLLQDRS